MQTLLQAHFFKIEVREKPGGINPIVEKLYWSGYTLEQFCRWRWYFEYRAALLKVKYPRYEVQVFWGPYDAVGKTKEHLLAKRISAAKAQVTKSENRLLLIKDRFEMYKNTYDKLFAIEEESDYKIFEQIRESELIKLEKKKRELAELQAMLFEEQQP